MANMCPYLSHLKLSCMYDLTEAGRLSMVSLLRQITQNNPQIEVLNMYAFSGDSDREQNIGELVFETLLNASVDSLIELDISCNESWFSNPSTREERTDNVSLLSELISRQTRLRVNNLNAISFSSTATQTLLTKIADVLNNIQLTTLVLTKANFEADETVEKLALILSSARYLHVCKISGQHGSR